jgi:mono/diheme cytochrome c family protein
MQEMNKKARPVRNVVMGLATLLVAICAFGAAAQGSRPAPDGWALDGDADDGKIVYKQYCQKCHGKRGDGGGLMAKDLDPKPRDFTNTAEMHERSDWVIFLGIKEGGLPVGLSSEMTAWEDTLTDEEMHNVSLFIREFAPLN